MPTSYGPAAIAVVIGVVAVFTYVIRVSFVALIGRIEALPSRLESALRFVPAAVLAALVAPAVVTVEPAGGLAVDKLLAGAVATAVAWRTADVLATMAAGMGVLWAVGVVI